MDLEPDDPQYGGQDFRGNRWCSRAQIVDAWAAALGASVVRRRWRDGRLELAMLGHIGPAGRDGKRRTPIDAKTRSGQVLARAGSNPT